MADIPALLKEVADPPDMERSLWGHNEHYTVPKVRELLDPDHDGRDPADPPKIVP